MILERPVESRPEVLGRDIGEGRCAERGGPGVEQGILGGHENSGRSHPHIDAFCGLIMSHDRSSLFERSKVLGDFIMAEEHAQRFGGRLASATRRAAARSTGAATAAPALVALIVGLFFIWGGATSLNDILIPKLKGLFSLTYTEAMLTQFAFFMAYLFVSIPAGTLIARIGYLRGPRGRPRSHGGRSAAVLAGGAIGRVLAASGRAASCSRAASPFFRSPPIP